MKFLILCTIAVLIVAVSAGAIHQPTHHEIPEPYHSKDIGDFGYDFVQICGRFYEFFKNFFYNVFEKVSKYLPAEFRVAFENLFKYWPSFNQFFTPEFYTAVKDFLRALKKFFMPHHFYGFVDNVFKALPTVTDFLPEEFFQTVARTVEHIPFARENVKQLYEVMQELIPHQYH